MDKAQALHTFWNSFQIPAYAENTVPPTATMPYITYNVLTDSMNNALPLTATLWYRTTAWSEIQQKAEQIAERLGKNSYEIIKLDHGYLWITKGTPFAQRLVTDDESVHQILINVMAEFLTDY